MALSNKWDMNDNIYSLNRNQSVVVQKCPEGVDPAVFEFSKKNSKKETYLYNNRLFLFYINPSQQRKDEYERNRQFIHTMK